MSADGSTYRVDFHLADLFDIENFEKMMGARDGEFDAVISNPPYIPKKDIENLSTEVKHEPVAALDGGEDGLDFYRAILKGWLELLKDGGYIAFEVGYRQARDVGKLMKEAGIEKIKIVEDTAGIQRVVSGFKKTSEE